MLSISSNIFVILENLFNLLGGNFQMPAAGGAWESQLRSEARHTVERPSTNWDAYQFVQIWDFYANQKWVFFALLGDSPPTVQIRTLYFNIEGYMQYYLYIAPLATSGSYSALCIKGAAFLQICLCRLI